MELNMKSERSRIIKRIDRNMSIWVRLSNSVNGYCTCVTCGTVKHWKDMHNGHFIPRGCMLTRFDVRNTAPQDPACNTYRNGEQAKFLIYIENKYGRKVVDELMELEKEWKSSAKGFSIGELRDLDKEWKEKVKELESNL